MNDAWPALPYPAWKDTLATLHRWLQIAGKVRLALSPHLNHFWEATFYLTARGLTSSAVPLPGAPGVFEMNFDFLKHEVRIVTSEAQHWLGAMGPQAGASISGTPAEPGRALPERGREGGLGPAPVIAAEQRLPLRPCSVAVFEREFLTALAELGIEVKIWGMPVEIPNPVRFNLDEKNCSYDGDAVQRWWRALLACERVFTEFRSRFIGKCSPVHLFWGSLDLAVTRFSGRRAPERPGADAVTREAYSHEVSSAGFWAGDDRFPEPAFYAYAVPEPQGFKAAPVQPAAAFYSAAMGEFLLRYDDVRRAPSPREALLDFMQSTYAAAAGLAGWDRASLER